MLHKKRAAYSWPKFILVNVGLVIFVYLSDIYLQFMQNDRSLDLALKFALSWHTEKFLLGTLVLWMLALFLVGLFGSYLAGSVIYGVSILFLGIATYLKMTYRMEPIYPDDLKMITEFSLLKEMAGNGLFYFAMVLLIGVIVLSFYFLYRSFFLAKKAQIVRGILLVVSSLFLFYCGHFNSNGNLLKKAYDKTALWIPYSQKMNYYNVGFVGGFLFNLNVPAMEEPENYSEKTISEITEKYSKETTSVTEEEKPNIVFVMSESFSDPRRLSGLTLSGNPLSPYEEIAQNTYSGQMLSSGFGGGTANIEFSALTGLSMSLFNGQMTTPYTMLVPKEKTFPSLVSYLEKLGYNTTAIHPYNTSMYKRKDVYETFGFNQFLSEDNLKHQEKIANNPYISDAAAYTEILEELKASNEPQFVHLVTMQTHMPYNGKYNTLDFSSTPTSDSLTNYYQDIYEASKALNSFLTSLNELDQRTLVVFWGDHLPGIYSDDLKKENSEAQLHLTEFLFYDSKNQLLESGNHNVITSPIYFAPDLFKQAGLPESGFYTLLQDLQKEMPAFENNLYYTGREFTKEFSYNEKAQKLYDDYQLIQYDITTGKKYSLETNFFTLKEK